MALGGCRRGCTRSWEVHEGFGIEDGARSPAAQQGGGCPAAGLLLSCSWRRERRSPAVRNRPTSPQLRSIPPARCERGSAGLVPRYRAAAVLSAARGRRRFRAVLPLPSESFRSPSPGAERALPAAMRGNCCTGLPPGKRLRSGCCGVRAAGRAGGGPGAGTEHRGRACGGSWSRTGLFLPPPPPPPPLLALQSWGWHRGMGWRGSSEGPPKGDTAPRLLHSHHNPRNAPPASPPSPLHALSMLLPAAPLQYSVTPYLPFFSGTDYSFQIRTAANKQRSPAAAHGCLKKYLGGMSLHGHSNSFRAAPGARCCFPATNCTQPPPRCCWAGTVLELSTQHLGKQWGRCYGASCSCSRGKPAAALHSLCLLCILSTNTHTQFVMLMNKGQPSSIPKWLHSCVKTPKANRHNSFPYHEKGAESCRPQ